ncbi:hypothetical protein QVD17_24406 [Tagetes erecta]|uniref:Uncharacterized protein n=1 Tax=Tagetes erecta TaxID=13708 RepID=A0AAD8KIK9_TARER|nr:hypothetical protein QVD17_24406 [Tagetes erecta]
MLGFDLGTSEKNKTKATSSDSTPPTSSTTKSQDSESPSDSNSDVYCLICDSETHHISDCIYSQGVFPYSSKSNKFKTPASSSKLQQDSEVKASTAKASQKQRKKSPFKAHQKYCEICEMYNHSTTECYYNKYCTNYQMYNHDTMECYYNKYFFICDMVNHNTHDCFYNKSTRMKPRRYVQRDSSSANAAMYVSDFKFSNGDHSSDSWKSRSCDEPHRELLCCGIHRPEVSHEVSFELQDAAKDSKMEQKESQMWAVTKQIPKRNSEDSQGEQ